MRYARQRKNSGFCGPIALLNAMKFTGQKVSWKKERARLKKLCNYKNGTSILRLAIAFCKVLGEDRMGPIVEEVTLPYLDKSLSNNKAVCLRFVHGPIDDRVGHFVLIIDKTDKTYTVINWSRSCKTVTRVKRKDMSKHLKYRCGRYSVNGFSKAWTISRKHHD